MVVGLDCLSLYQQEMGDDIKRFQMIYSFYNKFPQQFSNDLGFIKFKYIPFDVSLKDLDIGLINDDNEFLLGFKAEIAHDSLNSKTNPTYGSLYKASWKVYPNSFDKLKGEFKTFREFLPNHVLGFTFQAVSTLPFLPW